MSGCAVVAVEGTESPPQQQQQKSIKYYFEENFNGEPLQWTNETILRIDDERQHHWEPFIQCL